MEHTDKRLGSSVAFTEAPRSRGSDGSVVIRERWYEQRYSLCFGGSSETVIGRNSYTLEGVVGVAR